MMLASGPRIGELEGDALQHIRRKRSQQQLKAHVDIAPHKPQILLLSLVCFVWDERDAFLHEEDSTYVFYPPPLIRVVYKGFTNLNPKVIMLGGIE